VIKVETKLLLLHNIKIGQFSAVLNRPIRDYHIFNKKAYRFRVCERMNTHFKKRIWSINYSYVSIYDLEHLQDKPERLLTHYQQHKELRNAPVVFYFVSARHFRETTQLMQNGTIADSCLYL
jgi:hypothetical protein